MIGTRFDKPGEEVELDTISTLPPKDWDRELAAQRMRELGPELFALQDLMWGSRTHGLLIVLQGRDAAGKDGAVKNVVGYFNPRGVNVISFTVPTQVEREHDFLWRIHLHTPRKGETAIFNRSHYEDVLVPRVEKQIDKSACHRRFEDINAFERTLTDHQCIILKFYLHISTEEQEVRLLERETDPEKAWKLSVDDWRNREKWLDYRAAYEDAVSHCSTKYAPWIVVPADRKWFRDLVIAEHIFDTMRGYRKEWRSALQSLTERRRAELVNYRAPIDREP